MHKTRTYNPVVDKLNAGIGYVSAAFLGLALGAAIFTVLAFSLWGLWEVVR
jgi:hypothetical protein